MDTDRIFNPRLEVIHVSAPGKVILFGEHAVVLGKTSIATSLSLRSNIKVSFDNNGDDVLKLELPDIPDFGVKKYSLEKLRSNRVIQDVIKSNELEPTECSSEFQKILATFDENKGIQTILFLYIVISKLSFKGTTSIHFKSDLPMGAGLGSSASFCVCIAAALLQYKGTASLKCDDTDKSCSCKASQSLTSPDDIYDDPKKEISLCTKQLDLINKWSLQGEKIMHGTPSGIDNAVATYGNAISFTKQDGIKPLKAAPPLRLLIVNTKVSRSTKVLVDRVVKKHNERPDVMEPAAKEIDSFSKKAMELFDNNSISKNILLARVEEMVAKNQTILTEKFEVGHPTLNKIVEISRKHGFSAKLTGAGGGGCAIVLLKEDTTNDKIEEMKKEFTNVEVDGKLHSFDCWLAKMGCRGVEIRI